LKQCLLRDQETAGAETSFQQLLIYATGAAPFISRTGALVEEIVSRGKPTGYGVKTMIHEIVQSDSFSVEVGPGYCPLRKGGQGGVARQALTL